MNARVVFAGCLVLLSGCFRSTLVSFPPSRQVNAIEVSDAFDTGSPPLFTIKDPRRIERVLAFLHTKEGRWDPLRSVPSAGKYRAAFVGDDIRLFMRTGDNVLQIQGADYEVHYRDLEPEEQAELLALLSLDIDDASPGTTDLSVPADDTVIRP